MEAQRLEELEAELIAGNITDENLFELLTEGYGHSHESAQAACKPYGRYIDENGEMTYARITGYWPK